MSIQESVQENKTPRSNKVLNGNSNSKTMSPPFPSYNQPSSPRSVDSSSIKSSGMYVRKLPERLQRLQDEKKCPELSVKTFFDFMRTAYQVNDSFEELATTLSARSEIDWTKLAKTDLISRTTEADFDEDQETGESEKESSVLPVKKNKSTVTDQAKDANSEELNNDKLIATEHQESISNVTSQTKCRKLSLRKYHQNSNISGPQATLVAEESPPGESLHNQEKQQFQEQKNDTKKLEALEEQRNQSPKIFGKKTKIPTVETFAEHKEQLLAKIMKRKLSDILHEGVLDSVLPYMLPKPVFSQPVIKKSITDVKKTSGSAVNIDTRSAAVISKDKEKEKHKYRRKSFE